MNVYYSIVMRLIQDHFSEDDEERLLKELSERRRKSPQPMSEERRGIEYYKQLILNSRNKKCC